MNVTNILSRTWVPVSTCMALSASIRLLDWVPTAPRFQTLGLQWTNNTRHSDAPKPDSTHLGCWNNVTGFKET